MRLHIGVVAVIVVVAIGLTWYTSKHYNFSKLAEATGTTKDALAVAAATK